MDANAYLSLMYASVDSGGMYSYADFMFVRTVLDLAAAIKGGRRKRGWTQGDLARRAGVSRQWVVNVEKGKPTAEVGSVLRALTALGLTIDLVEGAPVPTGPVNLDDLLGRDDG